MSAYRTTVTAERPEVTLHSEEVDAAIRRVLENAQARNRSSSDAQTLVLDSTEFLEPLFAKVDSEEERIWLLLHVEVDVSSGFVSIWLQQTVGPGRNRYCHLHHWGSPQRTAIVTVLGNIDFYETGVRAKLQREIDKHEKRPKAHRVPRPRRSAEQ